MKWLTQRLLCGDDLYRILSCFGTAIFSTFLVSYLAFLASFAAVKVGLPVEVGIVAAAPIILPFVALALVSGALSIDSIWSITGVYRFIGLDSWALRDALRSLIDHGSQE